jgi:hypothetical protein
MKAAACVAVATLGAVSAFAPSFMGAQVATRTASKGEWVAHVRYNSWASAL